MGSEIIHENFSEVNEADLERVYEKSKIQVFDLLKRNMRPEFLNRIDEVVMFRPLTMDHLEGIIRIQLGMLQKVLGKQGISFEITDSCLKYLMREGFDLQYGARPLKRLIQKKILDNLSLAMLEGTVAPGMHVVIDVAGQKIVFTPKML
jgi:ATP-dependent Clp protease ATP-binding subunit ClpB